MEEHAARHVKRAQQLLGFGVSTHWLERLPQKFPHSIVQNIKKAMLEDARTVEDRLRMLGKVARVDRETFTHEFEHISVLENALECKQRIKHEWMNVVLHPPPQGTRSAEEDRRKTKEENQIIEWFKKVAPFDCEILGYAWHDLRKRHGFMDEMLQTGQKLNAYVTVLDELKEILMKDKSENRDRNIADAIINHLDHKSFFQLTSDQFDTLSGETISRSLDMMVDLEQRRRRSEIFLNHDKNQHEKYAAMFHQCDLVIFISRINTDIINSINKEFDRTKALLIHPHDLVGKYYMPLVFQYTIFETLREKPHNFCKFFFKNGKQSISVDCSYRYANENAIEDEDEEKREELVLFWEYLKNWVAAIFPHYTVF